MSQEIWRTARCCSSEWETSRSVNMCMAMAKAYARRVISPAFPSATARERRTRTAGRNRQISSLSCAMAGPLEFKGDDGEDAHRFRRHSEKRRSLMPADSYVSVMLRRQGYFEQARIRDWVADEHSTVEDGNEFVAAHTLCARVTAACADSRRNAELAQRLDRPCSRCSPT